MIKILSYTTKEPLQMIGECSGICWNSDISDKDKNVERALECINSGHTRVAEFPDVFCVIEGYSARCIRELYTHIVGTTRLQESTRYVDMNDFEYFTPESITKNPSLEKEYDETMKSITECYRRLVDNGIPKEDVANVLPLGSMSKMVWKINLRGLIHFMNMRLCNRAYSEIRLLSKELRDVLSEYSYEWEKICDRYFVPKCIAEDKCTEKNSCKKKGE